MSYKHYVFALHLHQKLFPIKSACCSGAGKGGHVPTQAPLAPPLLSSTTSIVSSSSSLCFFNTHHQQNLSTITHHHRQRPNNGRLIISCCSSPEMGSRADSLNFRDVDIPCPLQINCKDVVSVTRNCDLSATSSNLSVAPSLPVTGNPFFTTDTAAALRCAEINAEVVLKATNVDGIFDDDPKRNPNARLLDTLSYQEVTSKELSVMDMTAITLCQENNIPGMFTKELLVMDMTAITLCQENNIPVVVFNLSQLGNISKAIKGERVGTLIGSTWNSPVATMQ